MRARAAIAGALCALSCLSLASPAAAIETREIGTSRQGRPITAYRLGDPTAEQKGLVVGVIHGDETAGLRVTDVLVRRYADIQGVDLWVVPTINPDGMARGRRGNARRVDLNRNWSHRWRRGRRDGYYPGTRPFSEPETRAMRDFISEIQPDVSVWYHQPWNAVLFTPCRGDRLLQKRYAKIARMKTSCRGSDLRGTAITWQMANFPGARAMVVELRPGKLPKALARRNARAAAAVISQF